ncbi:MAG: 30S ribosomal protein S10 [Patescibacteria group bacterium]
MSATKMRVKIYSFDHNVLEEAVKKLVQVVIKSGGKVKGPIPLKTKKRVFTLLRSTFVYKKSRDKLECRVHKRLVDINEVNSEIINNLSTLSLPAGVDLSIETV